MISPRWPAPNAFALGLFLMSLNQNCSRETPHNIPHGFHEQFLALAISQARAVQGRTSPNPPVGCVVVHHGKVVGCGATHPAGGPHAERVALAMAGTAAHGADLYVTLEPCTFYGRTPPCTDAIREAGIRRVFFVAKDTDPRIGEGAAACLQPANIDVYQLPDQDGAVADILAPFRCRSLANRPLVTAKYAMTLDGRIATVSGASRWITGSDARRAVHELRDRVDVILVGVGTILADNSSLTTRLESHWRPTRHPLRVIVDSYGRTPLSSRLLAADTPGQTLFAVVDPLPEWAEAVQATGAQIAYIEGDAGRVDIPALLSLLAAEGHNHVLVEGGTGVLGTFAAKSLIDETWTFIGPKIVGGAQAAGPVGDPGVSQMADAHPFAVHRVERYGDDTLIVARAANAAWWG